MSTHNNTKEPLQPADSAVVTLGSTHRAALAHSDANDVLPFRVEMLAGQLAPSSIAMYARDMRAYLTFAGSAEAATQASTLARFRTQLAQETDLSPNTINRMLSAVKRVMLEAAAQGYLSTEQAAAFRLVAGVKAAALKDRVKANARTRIEPADMRTLCETPDRERAIGVRDAALLATLAGGGLRVSELRELRRSRIRRKEGGFVVLVRGKNDVEEREAPLSREAAERIGEWMALRAEQYAVACDLIFTAFDGRGDRMTERALSPAAVWQIVRKYSLDAGLEDVKPHDFRRFVGTQLARKDIRQAQKALGHKRLETTARHYVLDELEAGLTDTLYSEIPALAESGTQEIMADSGEG
jgi:integrase